MPVSCCDITPVFFQFGYLAFKNIKCISISLTWEIIYYIISDLFNNHGTIFKLSTHPFILFYTIFLYYSKYELIVRNIYEGEQ